MMKNNLQAKRIVITAGEVQLPIKVGEELCYRYDGHLMWTDRVHRIWRLRRIMYGLRLPPTTIQSKEMAESVGS